MERRGVPEPTSNLEEIFRGRLVAELEETRDAFVRTSDPLGLGAAFAQMREDLESIARALAEEVRAWVTILAPDRSSAMLARHRLAERWRLPWAVDGWSSIRGSGMYPRTSLQGRPEGSYPVAWDAWNDCAVGLAMIQRSTGGADWPARATAREVADWISTALVKHDPAQSERIRSGAALEVVLPFEPATFDLLPHNAAVLFDVHQEIAEGKKRQTFPVDAGEPHQKMLAGWAASPKHMKHGDDQPVGFPTGLRRLDLFDPAGRPRAQLSFDLGDSPGEALISALKDLLRSEFHSYDGLRSWAAILLMCGHDGRTVWTLDGHMEAMKLPPNQRTAERKKALADLVWFLLRLELRGEVVEERGAREGRRVLAEPLFELSSRLYRETLGGDQIEAIAFRLNPRVFGGVRGESGEIGENWWPTPAALPTLTARNDGPALALGLQLPIAFRLWTREQRAKGADPAAPLVREAEKMLRLAGIDGKHPWDRLQRALDTLVKIGLLGDWRWRDGIPARSGMLELRAAPWSLDRVLRGIRAERLLGGVAAPTGAEIRRWRQETGRTQASLAQRIGVSPRTIMRTEARAEERVEASLAAKLRDLGMPVAEWPAEGDR